MEAVWRFLKKLGIKPPYDPAIPLLGIYPEETKIEKDTCISLFIAALFTIARTWKQSRCPSTDEWIKKLWYIHTMEYYPAIKRDTFESVLMRWMNLEPIIQSEVSQKEKYSIVYMYHKFFIHSSVNGHLVSFHVLAIVKSAAVNNGIRVQFWGSSGYFFSFGFLRVYA